MFVLHLAHAPGAPPPPTRAHLEFAVCEESAEGDDVLGGDVLVLRLVLGHLVLQGDEADGRALLLLQAEELQDALVVIDLAVDEDEEDLRGGGGKGRWETYIATLEDGLEQTFKRTSTMPHACKAAVTHFRNTDLALEALGGLLELVHLFLEVGGRLGHEQENVGLDFPSEDLGGSLEEKERERSVNGT